VEGQVGEACVVTAFPGEPESCPAFDSQGDSLLCLSGQCETCGSAGVTSGSFGADCLIVFADEDQQENCLRDCFGDYLCTSNADCPADTPTCFIFTGETEGQCVLECEVSALPGAAGSCPDQVGSYNAGPQFCLIEDGTSICAPCTPFEQNVGITTAADCEKLTDFGQTADVVANCQRDCFGFYACDTIADCPDTLPFCDVSQNATERECVATDPSDCVVTAFPGEPGSCPALDGQGNPLLCVSGLCFTCESADIAVLGDCAIQFDGDADQIANCQRDCFAHYECTSNADCPANEPTCIIIGQCRRECEVNALPGAAGSCPDIPAGELFAGPEFCVQGGVTSVCIECARYEQELGITTAAECEKLGALGHTADDIANCQRGCFGFYACATSADCPADRPLCESGQCLCGTNADCPADRPLCESGQCLAECATDADCTDPSEPFCDVPEGATGGLCGECVVSAFPDETGSCPDIPGPQLCGRSTGTTPDTVCNSCAIADSFYGITSAADCVIFATNLDLDQEADVVANCQRSCFNFFACTFNADCPASLPFCNIPEGECVATDPSECVVSAFPGETGSCPDPDQACVRTISTAPKTVCLSCASFETEFGITTAAECVILENPPSSQAADVVANCQRECFEFYACAFDTDCPADRPLCDAGQCVVSSVLSSPTFSPLAGMGGGSSA